MDRVAILYLRTDVTWRVMSEDTFMDQERHHRSTIPLTPPRRREILQRIELWNRTFTMTYFEYRQNIKDIAELNRSHICNIDLVVRNRHSVSHVKTSEAIFIPVDDDDWFRPDIVSTLLHNSNSETDLISWRDAIYCPTRYRKNQNGEREIIFPRGLSEHGFATNAYAITAKGLDRFSPEDQAMMLDRHGTVLKTFRACQPCFSHIILEEPQSITHKSPASITKLQPISSQTELLDQMRTISREDEPESICMPWAKPYIRQAQQLNRELINGLRVNLPETPVQLQRCPAKQQPQGIAPRTRLMNEIIRRKSYRSYLEIGCGNNQHFSNIDAVRKIGVDPRQGGTHRMSSDDFFATNREIFDLVFIDGLHLDEQVTRDIHNSLSVLKSNGLILVHDCLPQSREQQERIRTTGSWMGDVWKAIVRLRQRHDLDVAVLKDCCGIGAILPRSNSNLLETIPELTWDVFVGERDHLLRILNPDEFFQFIQNNEPAATH
ncbi:class I SAM-dependent methyltransferase [Rubinisphaera margarita]|uniref:class I SAM-dependent methyltransferase n=1 Tax=Rubinisphaera margarita TaxID=2909586 RepID=UPI001EE9333A|nr:class I SAM-dependent methyltransferase [Rubinisphaera margarita]MCG6154359.1 class I SAM-dependent methyltransferase [Rubinisphaera margarita]